LVATLAHPLNRAEFDLRRGGVMAGYTLLQPRAEITPTSANVSLFSRIFFGDTGLDLVYARRVECLSRPVWRSDIHRQGHLRRRCL
jgi:cyclic beta-1,2-glucan synthetase